MSDAWEEMPAAGWYPDPLKADRERWWDGEAWTDHLQDAPAGEPEVVGLSLFEAQYPQPSSEPEFFGQTGPVPGLVMPDPSLAEMPVLSLPDLPPPALLTQTQAAPIPGLQMPDPSLAEGRMPGLSLPETAVSTSAQTAPVLTPAQYSPQPQLGPQIAPVRPGYVPPSPAPFPVPPADPGYGAVVQAEPARVASFKMSAGAVGGRGSSLQAVRAVRPPASTVKRSNPTAIVSFLFGVVALILPVIVVALVAVFTGLAGISRADQSYPAVGRGMAVAGVALGLISLILTAIAVMIAMADPEIRAAVLGYL